MNVAIKRSKRFYFFNPQSLLLPPTDKNISGDVFSFVYFK